MNMNIKLNFQKNKMIVSFRNILLTKKCIFFILLIIFSFNSLYPQKNPLFKTDKNQVEKSSDNSKENVQKNRFIWRKFTVLMAKINKILNKQFKNLKEDFKFHYLLILIAISFIYGFLHAAGPGHGKSLIVSYFLGHKSKVIDGIKVSFIIGSLHTAMGLLLAIFFFSILRGLEGSIKLKIQEYFFLLSGAIIIAIGLFLLIKNIIYKKKDENDSNLNRSKSIYSIALSVGIVPCPMTIAIAMFTFTMKYYFIGIMAIIWISIGISSFLLLVSIITIKAVNISFTKLITNKGLSNNILILLQYISSLLIILIGILMILSNIN